MIKLVNDPYNSFDNVFDNSIDNSIDNCLEELQRTFSRSGPAAFVLCNAGTRVSDHEGISAAGADPQARRLTPALDAEALLLGRTLSAKCLPVSPRGIVSPVVITRACLKLLNLDIKIVDCGSFKSPELDSSCKIQLSDQVADCPSSGAALSLTHVEYLFQRGLELGESLSKDRQFLLLAECVPGGTTTALAVLTALGFKASGLVSSSLPESNHQERFALVNAGLLRCSYKEPDFINNPLLAISAFGDPMQAVLGGIAISAAAKIPVYLAGGSQMLAVWALIRAISEKRASGKTTIIMNNMMVMSTSWVVFDQSAAVAQLAKLVNAPMLASCIDFARSRHPGLRAYEEGNVKEGVGAGAAMCMAFMHGFKEQEIMDAIDNSYDELLGLNCSS